MLDKQLEQLESHLADLLAEHRSLLSLIQRKRQALQRADARAVGECCELENQRVQQIGTIEKARQAAIAQVTRQLIDGATQPLTLLQIAERCDEPRRSRLLGLRAEVRDCMEQVRREAAVTRMAMDRLLAHVNGVVQGVVQAIGGGGTYGRRGHRAVSPAMAGGFSATV